MSKYEQIVTKENILILKLNKRVFRITPKQKPPKPPKQNYPKKSKKLTRKRKRKFGKFTKKKIIFTDGNINNNNNEKKRKFQ